MCKKTNYKTSNTRIDKCMRPLIEYLKKILVDEIKACCCGHSKYPMTIIICGGEGQHWDLFTGINIPRKRKFYKRDEEGYYYIPELENV